MTMYQYEKERDKVFTDEGQRMFLRIRDCFRNRIQQAGCVRLQEGISNAGGGDSWTMLACVDRLVELGEIREISQAGVAVQHRIFVGVNL